MISNREQIVSLLSQVSLRPDVQVISDQDNLFHTGIIDSIAIVQLVTLMESQFSITFDFKDLDVNNFRDIESIQEMLKTKYGVK